MQINIDESDQILIEEVKGGMFLAVERDGELQPARVRSTGMGWDDAHRSTYTVTFETEGFGDPWATSGPPGTWLTRLVRKQ